MIVSMTPVQASAPQPEGPCIVGVLAWELQARAGVIGVTVRAGENGPVLPAFASRIDALGVTQPVDPGDKTLSARFNPTDGPVSLTVSLSDVRRVCTPGTHVTLHATVYTLTGTFLETRPMWLADQAPDGLIRALIAADGTYFAVQNLDATAAVLTVYHAAGSYVLPAGGTLPVTYAPGHTERPLSVTATDCDGNESGNLLVSVRFQGGAVQRETPYSAWPLPPYLDATQPNLAALLRAFEWTLDVQPDYAGQALSLDLAEDAALTLLASHFGADRQPSETDGDLQTRAKSVLTANKSSIAGLNLMLRIAGVFGGQVHDLFSLSAASGPLTFNGAATFNGAHTFNGGAGPFDARYGMVLAEFSRVPAAGFTLARAVLERYAAAGVGVRVVLSAKGAARVINPTGVQARKVVTRSVPFVRGTMTSNGLTFDGSTNFNGSQTFNGVRK